MAAEKNIEEGLEFTPKFDDKGLITAIAQDSGNQTFIIKFWSKFQNLMIKV